MRRCRCRAANCHQAIEPRYANTINFTLSNVWKGTAKAVGAPAFPSAGKTGTTSKNEDTWFVGYTPLLSTAVWVGFSDSFKPVQYMTINGKYVKYTFGSTIAAPTWKRFMETALDGAANPGFAEPDQKLVYGEKVPVPSVVGKSEKDAKRILERTRVQLDHRARPGVRPRSRPGRSPRRARPGPRPAARSSL